MPVRTGVSTSSAINELALGLPAHLDHERLRVPRHQAARIDKTEGMVVAYATAPDDVAKDGEGRNSPFTAALLKRLQEPGLEIGMMFRRVASDVNAQTGGRERAPRRS